MIHPWIGAASVSGALVVLMGAFGSHGLRNILSENGIQLYQTAVLYQMFHTLALFGVGILKGIHPDAVWDVAGWSFLTGIVLFSGSLYAIAITEFKWLGIIAPVGGIAFVCGWAAILYTWLKHS
jgi:uncharacterized membrane protein YgdD (TMEM256/DUF423 family)